MTKLQQDAVTQRRRLKRGSCPVHGIRLCQSGYEYGAATGDDWEYEVYCPRRDCDFTYTIQAGSEMDKLLRE